MAWRFIASRRTQYNLFAVIAQKPGFKPPRVRDFPADREIFPRDCPERFRPFVVLLKRTKKQRKERQNMSTSRKKTAASIIWFEIPADDLDRAKTFYASCSAGKSNRFPA